MSLPCDVTYKGSLPDTAGHATTVSSSMPKLRKELKQTGNRQADKPMKLVKCTSNCCKLNRTHRVMDELSFSPQFLETSCPPRWWCDWTHPFATSGPRLPQGGPHWTPWVPRRWNGCSDSCQHQRLRQSLPQSHCSIRPGKREVFLLESQNICDVKICKTSLNFNSS